MQNNANYENKGLHAAVNIISDAVSPPTTLAVNSL